MKPEVKPASHSVQPVTTRPPAPPLPSKNGLSSIEKLKQQIVINKKEQALVQEEEKTTEPELPVEVNTPVTPERFAEVWNNYLSLLETDKKMSLWVIFRNATWEIGTDGLAEIVLASQHESDMFEEERINAIPFLRSNLKNTAFDVKIKVNSVIRKTRVFTAEEKFTAMAEKNPLLNELRNLLALDLEY